MLPVKLILENFISHLYSVVDFTKFNVALVLGSYAGDPRIANAVGKSALMVAIRFVLYGKTNYNIKTKVVKRGKSFCKVELQFMLEDELYKIVRLLDAKSGIINIEFSKLTNGKWISDGLTGDTTTQTNNRIIELIGMNDDTFINIIYFRQNDVSGFTSATVSKRKEMLKEALRINIWDEYQKIAKINEKRISDKIKLLDEKLKILENVEIDIKKNKRNIKYKQKYLNNLKEKVNNLENELKENTKKITDLQKILFKNNGKEELIEKLKNIKIQAKQLKEKKCILQDNVKNNNYIIATNKDDCNSLNIKLINYYKDILLVSSKFYNDLSSEYKKLTNVDPPIPIYSISSLEEKEKKNQIVQRDIDILKFKLKQLMSMDIGDECPVCLTTFKNPENIKSRREIKQKLLNNDLNDKKELFKYLGKEINKERKMINNFNSAVIEIERIRLINSQKLSEVNLANNNNIEIKKELKSLINQWNTLKNEKKEIDILIEQFNDTNINNELNVYIKRNEKINDEIDSFKNDIIQTSIELGNIQGFGEELNRRLSEKNTILLEKNNISEDLIVYSELNKAFGKDGIQSIIMENITGDLCDITNSILKTMYYKPIFVDFKTQRQTDSGSWKEDFNIVIANNGEEFDFEDLSGGEQVRVSIAIRVALSQLLMRRLGANIKFLLFDEVDQALDRHGVEAFAESINNLAKEFKILVITHNDYMKEAFEHILTVHMGNSGSTIIDG